MYQPPHFVETRRDVILELIRAHPLATLVVSIAGTLLANHVPMLMDEARGEGGVLRAHVARANELARLPAEGVEALAVFQGPDAYITPSWYETKRDTGKVVPTWNYAVVHAHGRLKVVDDAAWLRRQIGDLTDRHEERRAERWHVEDAPEDFVRGQVKGIVGLELAVTRLEAKWKVSQNRSAADRAGVVAGLRADEGDASPMAALVAGKA
jgi:transcriptional regulator